MLPYHIGKPPRCTGLNGDGAMDQEMWGVYGVLAGTPHNYTVYR